MSFSPSDLRTALNEVVPVDAAGYEAQMRFKDLTDISGLSELEQDLHSKFSSWLNVHNSSISQLLNGPLTTLLALYPCQDPVLTVLPKIQTSRMRGIGRTSQILDTKALRQRKIDHFERTRSLLLLIRQWTIYGVVSTAIGAINWRRLWTSLQASNLWGPPALDEPVRYGDLSWKLNPMEGPERSRNRLEIDWDDEENKQVLKFC